ncbi:hypothetical protein SAMN02799632_03840 [Acinetobacter pittii]|mgnify:FL=1|uniref:hypothetical protein n=1 Tax=Acinetobacter TaxID=469 RepID=UPI0004F57124|nr:MULTISPECIES: hypothetical protein [Acinetobacter]KQE23965.1 hypothetical protein APD38_07975 [Acinetobacter pittii]KQE30471.1 hypothetical protein APD39_05250 [Acinetobacter pittii]KQE52551.1 hypothetical protein APD46_09080 [Acinetobacter pittii]KRJ56366.1 hypothetical protein APC88_05865 [Acinetobacter pittii]MBJ8488173.1 hypothetical protein [Acinetobacter pittii]
MKTPIGTKLGIYNKVIYTMVFALVAGCYQQEADDGPDAVKLPVYQFNGVSGSARLKGNLELKQGCLYVKDILIVFPEHTAQWDAEKNTLSYKGQQIGLGNRLDITGNIGDFEQDNLRIRHLSPMCDHQNIWFAG